MIKNLQWMNVSESVIGKTHQRLEMPNQDAVLTEVISDDMMVSVVADGHGSKKCIRSHTGAKFAVESAIITVKKNCEDFLDEGNLNTKVLGRFLTEQLVAYWRQLVDEDLLINPIEEDLLELNDKEIASLNKNPYVAYGSTLVMVLFIKEFVVCYQLGDGDILFVSKAKTVSRPFTQDERHIANSTTSLCLHKPEKEFKIKVFRDVNELLQMVILSTDGYSNSFSDETGFLQVGTDIYEIVETEGFEILETQLKAWLEETTQNGSGDDTSVSIISRCEPTTVIEVSS